MTNCLGDLNYLTCFIYLDDIFIYSSMQEEHIKHLQAVLKCFKLHGLKLKPLKCELFKEKIEYLGHSVSSKGMWPSRDNLKAIAKYPEPTMYTAIKGFIGLIGYHRHFIKDFTKIADPLHENVRGDTAKKKKEWVVLNEVAWKAFHKLKKAVMSAPVLAYPDPSKEYLLEMDAWKLGLGAVLSQKQSDGRYHPVAFRSRLLLGVEVNYHSTKLKFLAMKWSIEHFQNYLLGHFKVHTDNNPLTYFLTSPNSDASKQRWINELAKYDFSLKYQKGKTILWQMPWAELVKRPREHSRESLWFKGMIQFLKSSKRRRQIGDQKRPLLILCLQRPWRPSLITSLQELAGG